MDTQSENNIGDTISIRRPPRVVTDNRGRTIWMGGVDSFELELNSDEEFNPYDSGVLQNFRLNRDRVPL